MALPLSAIISGAATLGSGLMSMFGGKEEPEIPEEIKRAMKYALSSIKKLYPWMGTMRNVSFGGATMPISTGMGRLAAKTNPGLIAALLGMSPSWFQEQGSPQSALMAPFVGSALQNNPLWKALDQLIKGSGDEKGSSTGSTGNYSMYGVTPEDRFSKYLLESLREG